MLRWSQTAGARIVRIHHAPADLRRFSVSYTASKRASYESRALKDLPRKAEVEIAHRGRLASVVPPRRCFDITHRVGSKFGGSHSLKWISPPQVILLMKKANDQRTVEALEQIIQLVEEQYPDIQLVTERSIAEELSTEAKQRLIVAERAEISRASSKIDLVVAVGGDGTVLNVASLFSASAVPPVLGVSMGSLGFLMPFSLQDFGNAFNQIMQSEASLLLRMRLECSIHDAEGKRIKRLEDEGTQVLNEIHLHRGRHSHLTVIDTFVDGQHLTEAISDGLIISTPTGSTAYSLSAGGPIVHPSVPSLLLTPICPRSLSFRSVLLPTDVRIHMKISPHSRAAAELSLDGRAVGLLEPHEYLTVSMSRYPVPCVVPDAKITSKKLPQALLRSEEVEAETEGRTDTDSILDGGWVQDINGMLSFNKAFVTKGMLKHFDED